MAKRKDKQSERVRQIFNRTNQSNRIQWEYINQKAHDFSNDNQLTAKEKIDYYLESTKKNLENR